MMRVDAKVLALIIFLSVRVMKVMTLFFVLILFINRRNKNGYVSKI